MTQTNKRRVGRKRWGDLIRFLTEKMKTAKSEKVQMTAAQRLTEILILREEREQLELRRELRALAKAGDEPEETSDATPAPLTAEERAERLIASVRQRKAVTSEQ